MTRSTKLPLEVLQTFTFVIDCGGNAAEAAALLKIKQPNMSKRLRRLQVPSKIVKRPWIFRDGNCWKMTDEGQRVMPAVRDLVGRYVQLATFTGADQEAPPEVRFACGRQTVSRFVRRAARHFWNAHQHVHLRISTLPGPVRIAGVANGSLDLATVSQKESQIHELARRDLYVETLFRDRLALVCPVKRRWAKSLKKLPKFCVGPSGMVGLPLLLPAADAGVRAMLNQALRKSGHLDQIQVRLEVSSWSTLLAYAADGLGVAVLSESAVPRTSKLVVRYLDPDLIPPFEAKIICRCRPDQTGEPDLTPEARDFYRAIKRAARRRWD